jgi:hypothetical protein
MTLAPLTINSTPQQIRAWRSSRAWRALARTTVRTHPVCHIRVPGGCTTRSTTADHIIPAAHRPDLFMAPSNVAGACKPCNDWRRDLPMPEVRALIAAGHVPAHIRKNTPGYARRRIASHRRPSRAAATFFTA